MVAQFFLKQDEFVDFLNSTLTDGLKRLDLFE